MSAGSGTSLAAQRDMLRARILSQRELIDSQLQLPAQASAVFPRSITMRLLIRRPDLAARLLGGLSRLLRR